MKYKNVGNDLKPVSEWASGTTRQDAENLVRYRDKSKRTSKSNLTKGAFGCPHED
jgi:hypothetical protein